MVEERRHGRGKEKGDGGTPPGDRPGQPAPDAAALEPAEADVTNVDPATIDTGAPLTELADLGLTPTPSFMERIRRKIGRRVLTADVVDFATTSPFAVFIEFLSFFFSGLAPTRPTAPARPPLPTDPPRGDGRHGGSN
jgi:hypothetical protein